MTIAKRSIPAMPLLLVLGFTSPALGNDIPALAPAYATESTINGSVLHSSQGVIAVNLAAGDDNLQLNAAALAASFGHGAAQARVTGLQLTEKGVATPPQSAVARIGDQAFANATGLITVNQASGAGNAQANGVAIAFGLRGEVVAESTLEAIVSGPGIVSLADTGHSGLRSATVDDTAFANAHGLVQINQLAGSGNSTANNFAFRISLQESQ